MVADGPTSHSNCNREVTTVRSESREIENVTKNSYSSKNSESKEKNSKLTAHGYSRQHETLRIINRVFYRKELGISRCNYYSIETKKRIILLQHARNVGFINVNANRYLQFIFE